MIRILLILLAFLGFSLVLPTHASAVPIKLTFKVLDDQGEPIKGTTVNVYRNNRVFMTKHFKRSNIKIMLEDKNDEYYTLEVMKDDYVVKRIGIHSAVDDEGLEMMVDNKFKFFIELERESKFIKYENPEYYTDYPAALVEFDRDQGVFDYNQTYWISSRRHLARLKATLSTPKF